MAGQDQEWWSGWRFAVGVRESSVEGDVLIACGWCDEKRSGETERGTIVERDVDEKEKREGMMRERDGGRTGGRRRARKGEANGSGDSCDRNGVTDV